MTATDVQKPNPAAAPPAWRIQPAVRLAWLHLLSRRVPAALVALAACGMFLWAALAYHWWLGTGPAVSEVPTLVEGCAAAVIAVTTHGPLGETERAAGRWLPVLRLGTTLALCGAAIGFLAAGAALAYHPQVGVALAGGVLPVARNVLGMAGIGLLFSLVTGGLLAWTGPLAFTAVFQFALIANYSEPLTWPSRPPADRGGWIAAMVVFAVGLVAFTIRGPRVRPSGELRQANSGCRGAWQGRHRHHPSAADQSPVSRKAGLYTDLAPASKTAPNASASPAQARARNGGVGVATLGGATSVT